MVDQALKSHIEILSDSYSVKEQIKKNYAIKCVDDMKKGVLIVPAIRQLLKITRGMVKQQFNKNDKVVLSVQHKKLITHREPRTECFSPHAFHAPFALQTDGYFGFKHTLSEILYLWLNCFLIR